MSQVIVNTLDIEIRNSIKKTGTYEKALRIYIWSSLTPQRRVNCSWCNLKCAITSNDLTLSVSFIAEGAITTTSNINNDMSFCSINRKEVPFFIEYNLGLKHQDIKKPKITTEIYLSRSKYHDYCG